MEHDPASTDQSVREALCQKIADVKADHNLLRRLSVALRHAVIEIKGSVVSIDEAVLALNMDMLVLLLNERRSWRIATSGPGHSSCFKGAVTVMMLRAADIMADDLDQCAPSHG